MCGEHGDFFIALYFARYARPVVFERVTRHEIDPGAWGANEYVSAGSLYFVQPAACSDWRPS